MPSYELTVIFKPDLKKEKQEKAVEGLKKIIESKKSPAAARPDTIGGRQGKVLKIDLWGKKSLAYEIEKQKEGVYLLVSFEADPKVLSELEKKIKLEENIIRYLIVRTE